MKFALKCLIPFLIIISVLVACQKHPENKPKAVATATKKIDVPAKIKIGIILPLEHKALDEIVAGFTDKIREIYPDSVSIKVMNAQGDMNLQRAILQQIHDQNYDVIVPVTTGVTQMAVSMIHDKPIVSLAAVFSDEDRQKLNPCNVGVVHDEVQTRKLIAFIHEAYPNLKYLTLIYSSSDKIQPQVKHAIAAGDEYHIDVKPLMINTLPELVSASQALPEKTQGIFILKDNLIASGIATLVKVANDKHLPLFTSDQGTVESGAGFSLGVRERKIGEEGAILATGVLLGDSICQTPIVEMKDLTVFINKDALQKEMQTPDSIIATAKKLNYAVEFISRK